MNNFNEDDYLVFLAKHSSDDLLDRLLQVAQPEQDAQSIVDIIGIPLRAHTWSSTATLSSDALFVIAEELSIILANYSSIDITKNSDAAYLSALFLWSYSNNSCGGEYEAAKAFFAMILYTLVYDIDASDAHRKFLEAIRSRMMARGLQHFAIWEIQLSSLCCVCASLRLAECYLSEDIADYQITSEATDGNGTLGEALRVLCMPEKNQEVSRRLDDIVGKLLSFTSFIK